MSKSYEFVFNIGANLGAGFKAAFASASGTMKNLGSNIKDLKAAQKMYDSALKAGAITQKSYDAGINKITASLNRQKNAQKNLSSAIAAQDKVASMRNNVQRSMMGAITAGSALAGPVVSAGMAAVNFESAMADVRKVVDFETPEQFNDMKNDIVGLTQVLPMAAEDIAKIVAAGGQSGIAKEDLLSFAESAAKMGVAFDITADEAGEMMAKWRTAFRMNQEEVVDLADKINYLGNNTAASAPKISDVVRRIGPLGDVGGVASGEIAALGASMVGAGIESEVAATGIKNMILGLVAGEGATKSQAGAFIRLGLDATDMAKRMQTDAKGAIIDVLSRIKDLDKYEQASLLKDLFGSESLSAISPLLSNLDNLQKNMDLVADKSKYTGSMQAEFAARCETTANALQLAKNSVMAMGIAIGNNFLPYLKTAAGYVSETAKQMAAWANENPTTVTTILTVVAAVGTAIVGFTGLAYVVLSVIYPFMQLHKMYQTIKASTIAAELAQKAFNLTALSNPYLWIAIAVVAACLIIYANWDSITSFMSSAWQSTCSIVTTLWNGFCNFMSSAWEMLKAGVTGFINLWVNLPSYIAYAIGFLIGYIATLPGKIAIFIINAGNFLYELPGHCYNAGIQFIAVAEAWLSNAYSSTVTWISVMVNEAGVWLMGLPDTCMEAGMHFVASAESWASEAYNSVVNWISQIPNAISNYISNAWSNLSGSFTVGMADGGNVQVAQNAQGGIYGKGSFLTTFAEEGPEAAIPLDGSPRAISLWQQAGQALGMNTSGGVSVSAPISITINGNADQNTVQQIKGAVDDSLSSFKRNLAALQNQNRRVAYD